MSTNYYNTFIAVSPDSRLGAAKHVARPGTVAALQLEFLLAAPYALTSDDLLFQVHLVRLEDPVDDLAKLRAKFESKPHACLRASPLVKTHGWGLHHDAQGRVAAVPVGDAEYQRLAADTLVTQVNGMRSKRA